MRNTLLFTLGFAALTTMFVAQAGPPLICHPYNIGDAKSLPWSTASGWDAGDSSYNLKNLATDTLAILDQNPTVLVRMETLRRAVLYGAKDHAAARALLAQLKERETANEKSAGPSASAYFDYGYFLASLNQVNWLYKEDLSAGVDGYQFVEKALALDPDSPEMHFAAAIMAASPPRPVERDAHLAKARAAKSDGLLAQNLATHFQ
jgi:hypothetical protein